MQHHTKLLFLTLLTASGTMMAQEPATEGPAPEKTAPTPASAASEEPDPTLTFPLSTDLPAEPKPIPAATPTQNVTVNLINRLVQKGVLTQAEAAEMIQQAEADAAAARQTAAARADLAALPPEPTPAEEARITYIPEYVRNQMRDQIKQELMAQAREESWTKESAPDWTSKFRIFGDIRGRYEGTFFPEGNDNSQNFNATNSGAPYDEGDNNKDFAPQYNVDQDRHRTRIRARLGTDIMLGDGFNAGLRIATGDSNSPTSTNQTLGSSGGNFSKYAVWLDRAFISYDAGPGDGQELTFLLGRFDNPFFSTEILWDDDLGFDGLALRGKADINDKAKAFFTAGYFPVYNTDFNFASNQPEKFESTDKWLAGAQLGVDWKIADHLTAKIGAAYYDFMDVEGKLSSPFVPVSASDPGETDATRPGFAQRGNTYMRLRDIEKTAFNENGKNFQYQYFGLASEFRNVVLTGKLDYDGYDPYRLSLIGELTKNVAFDSAAVAGRAVNNFESNDEGEDGTGDGKFEGGDMAWYLALQFGKPALQAFGDWQAAFGYRYVESDAVVDGFTDSDFGGGGTNLQGFTIGGSFALTPAMRLGLRWMSSDEIAGPPLSSDILQFDINAKF